MLNFSYCSPTNFVFGKDTEQQVGELISEYSVKRKVLIVYGSDRVKKSGLMDKVEDALHTAGISYVELSGVQPNPLISLVREGIDLARKEAVDFILAVGGGSVLDTGKGIACGVPYAGDINDFLSMQAEPQSALPVGVILTLSATGSEGSNCAVITNDEGEKAGLCNELIRPKFAIMDPALTCTVPQWHTACGSCDIMAHILEAYFTPTEDVEATDEFIEGLLRTVIRFAPVAIETPDNYNARAQLMWCGMLANSGFFHVGRLADTAPHALGECLGAKLTHGATLSAVIPSWMAYTYQKKLDRYIRYAEKVWGIDTSSMTKEEAARSGVEATRAFFVKLGAPVSLEELGLDPDTAPERLAAGDFFGWTQIPCFIFELDEADRRSIYEMAARK